MAMVYHQLGVGIFLRPKNQWALLYIIVFGYYKQQSSSTQSSKSNATRIKSGDYKAWDKYDVEKELAAAETSTTSSSQTTSLPQLFTEKGY